MTAMLFGFPPRATDSLAELPPEVSWRVGSAEDLARSGEDGLWVVHGAAVNDFRALRGDRAVAAVVWAPREGAGPPADWWEDFHALFREGNAEDARSLARCARCPAALRASEAVEEIPSDWFLGLSGPPSEAELQRLPEEFLRDHGPLLGDPDCRAEVLSRLRDRSTAVRLHLFPHPETVSDWLAGKDVPGLDKLAARSAYFRALVRGQAEVLLDAGLADEPILTARLASLGIGPLRHPEERETTERAPSARSWTVNVSAWLETATSAAADAVAAFADAVVRALVGEVGLVLELSESRGLGSAAEEASPPEDASAEAAEFLRDNLYAQFRAPEDRTVLLTWTEDGLAVRISGPGINSSPRLRFLRDSEEVLSISGQLETESPFLDGERTALVLIEPRDLAQIEAARATHLEIVF
jgi:hypothetical protein